MTSITPDMFVRPIPVLQHSLGGVSLVVAIANKRVRHPELSPGMRFAQREQVEIPTGRDDLFPAKSLSLPVH
jgi:hypothetical protein